MWPQSLGECTTSESLEAVHGVTLRETHKFLCARKIKELHQPKVVSRDDVQACMGHTGTVDISLVCISRPDANDFVSQNAVPKERGVRSVTLVTHSCSQASSPGRRGRVSAVTWLLCPSPICALAPAPAVLCLGCLSPQKTSSLHLWFSPSSP